MSNWWSEVLRCPICGASTEQVENSLFCVGARRHCFDFASAGYVNLALSRAAGGDDATLIASRISFLSGDFYRPIADKTLALLERYAPGGTVLDAGCGEGYYSCHMARNGARVIGLDLSKNGVKHAAKQAKKEALPSLFGVAGIFELPIADASLDAVVSLFAPVAEEEFLRVLKPGGVLIVAGAGPRHLFSLKQVLYDTPYENDARADLPQKMSLLESECLRFDMSLNARSLQDLFSMTPYFYRTSLEGKQRLAALEALEVNAEVEFAVYQKA